MKRSHKILLLISTLLPIIIIPFFIIWIIGGAIGLDQLESPELGAPVYVGSIIFWALAIGFLSLITWIIFLVHAIRNETIETTERVVWLLLFIFFGLIPQLVYFFLRIWPEEETLPGRRFNEIQFR